MKFKLVLFVGLVLVFLFGFFGVKVAFASSFGLSGHISDSSGNSVSNAEVAVTDSGTNTVVASTTSDTQGSYSVSVPSGTYGIMVTPPSGSNFGPVIAPNYVIQSDKVIDFILVPVGPTITLSGHVYGPLGDPLPNQRVLLQNYDGVFYTTVATAFTDSSGAYSLQAPAGTYSYLTLDALNSLSINAPERYTAMIQDFSLTQSTVIDFTIPAKRVSVHVQDSQNNPVGNVSISTSSGGSVVPIGGGLSANVSSQGGAPGDPQPTTDSSGNATLWLIPGTYTVTATPPSGSGFGATSSSLSVTTDETQAITLSTTVTLSGHVYGPLGDPLPNQRVLLQNHVEYYYVTVATASTDSSGAYSLQAPAGTYSYLIVEAVNPPNSLSTNAPQNYTAMIQDFSLTQSTVIDFTIPAKRVDIHVQDSFNNPISNVTIKTDSGGSVIQIGGGLFANASSTYGSDQYPGPTTDSSGNATLWLIPGTYTLTATPPTGSNFTLTSISNVGVTSDTQEIITLPMSVTLSGHVYGPLGDPLPNQRLLLQNHVDYYYVTVASTYTNSLGAYSLQAPAGTYSYLTVDALNSLSTNAPQRYSANVANFSLTQNTIVDLTIPAKRVSVHVQDSQNNPVGNVGIGTNYSGSVVQIGGGLSAGVNSQVGGAGDPRPTTDSSGNATLWLISGTYTITATPPSGSVYLAFNLGNIQISGDQTEIISLQYSHSIPVTTAVLSPATDNQGNYSDPTTITLSATAASDYTVSNTYYTIDGGDQQTYTAPFPVSGVGDHTITYWSIDNVGVFESPNTKTFTIVPKFSLIGTVYVDANQNGFQDSGELGYTDATVMLDNGQSVTTDASGSYSFSGLQTQFYVEALSVPSGYLVTTANPVTIPLTSDTTQNFGIAPLPTPTETPTPTPTETPTPTLTPIQLSALNPAKVWVGLKNSDDVGVKFDLKAEAYVNDTLVSTGELDTVNAGSSGFNNAKLDTINFNSFSPVDFPSGTTLSVKFYVRNACTGSEHNSGTARLWYNDSAANSQFSATIDSNLNNYYLVSSAALLTVVGTGPKKTIDVQAGAKCSPFKLFGTWTTTP